MPIITKWSYTIKLPFATYEVLRENDYDLELIFKRPDGNTQIHLYETPQISYGEFIKHPADFAIHKEKRPQLRPYGSAENLPSKITLVLQELRVGDQLFPLDDCYAAYFVAYIGNPYTANNLYVYVSILINKSAISLLNSYIQEAKKIIQTAKFKPQVNSNISAQPDYKTPDQKAAEYLKGHRFHRMESYSSGYSNGGGGYSTEEIIDLYDDNTCKYQYVSVISGGNVGGVSLGGGFKEDKAAGRWHVVSNALRLHLSDGRIKEWPLKEAKQAITLVDNSFRKMRL